MQTEDNHTQQENNNLHTKPLVKKSESVFDEYYLHARPEVLELVPFSARRVLDVGCGAGGFGATLKNRQTVEVHGVELVAEAAQIAKKHLDHVRNKTIEDALPDLPESYYDCIVAADVFEHLIDPWAVLSTLKNKLAPGGKIIASIPNIQNWEVISDLMQGRWDYHNEGILDRTHLRFFTRKSVEELFWRAGLHITNLGTTVHGATTNTLIIKSLVKAGLSLKELTRDGQTYQFLIEAEIPKVTTTPKIAVVILNWNGKEDILECLASVKKIDYPNYEIVLVDNGSVDGSADAISKQYPAITLLQTGENLGYAGGNNVGIRWALEQGADYILLLNNDTIVATDLLSAFINATNLLPSGSILGAKIYFYDNPDTLWFAGGRWRSESNSFEHLGYGQPDSIEFNHKTEVDYITGCALFADAATFKEVGLLGEDFFLTYEETDWCYRAGAKDHKCIVIPEAKLWHKVSSSFGGADSPLVNYFMTRNKLLWAKKHLSYSSRMNLHKKSFRTLRCILLPSWGWVDADVSIGKQILWCFSSWLKTIKRNIANPINKSTLIGLRDYYLGRFGNCPSQVRKLGKLTH